ncbi:MAG: C10 family peptidase, partial [Bacteroidia bacterium]|nr:C10 family peptidase [Bacteroidia bacterium]
MAQIMKYHRWPVTGIGTHSYTDANYGNQSVDFSKTTYNWDNMLGSYTSGGTSDQNSAVATLIYQCGVAVDMAYSTTSSSSFSSKAAEALVNHFGYDTEIQRYERPYYTSSEWNNLIKKELNNARPVYFSANSDAGGHAFVCDGYDSNSLFHINWGWGGSSNGYFELSSLSTENPGIAGAAPEFVYSQSILTGIHKADVLKTKTNQVVAYNTGLTSTTSSVNKIATSSFTLTYYFANTGLDTVKIRR